LVAARELLVSVHGFGKHGAEELLAEIGPDMSVFPTPQAPACWVGVAPGSHESAGKKHSVKARAGNRYAKRALGIAANALQVRADGPRTAPRPSVVQPVSAEVREAVCTISAARWGRESH
jgi:transposase